MLVNSFPGTTAFARTTVSLFPLISNLPFHCLSIYSAALLVGPCIPSFLISLNSLTCTQDYVSQSVSSFQVVTYFYFKSTSTFKFNSSETRLTLPNLKLVFPPFSWDCYHQCCSCPMQRREGQPPIPLALIPQHRVSPGLAVLYSTCISSSLLVDFHSAAILVIN